MVLKDQKYYILDWYRKSSKQFLAFLVKAQLARDIYDDNAFFKIYNETNEIYTQAIELLKNPDQLLNKSNGLLLQTR